MVNNKHKRIHPLPVLTPLSADELAVTTRRLTDRAFAQMTAKEIAEKRKKRREIDPIGGLFENNETETRTELLMYQAMFDGGLISEYEFFFHCVSIVENWHDNNVTKNIYPDLNEISKALKAIEEREGLKEDQYWHSDEGPEDYEEFQNAWELSFYEHMTESLHYFGLHQEANMFANNRDNYDILREKGRKAVFEKEDIEGCLIDLLNNYEDEASKCDECGSYYAANILLASAAETRLLLTVIRHPQQVNEARIKLQEENKRFQINNPLRWNLDDLTKISVELGWIKDLDIENIKFRVQPMLDTMRELRNLVHPGRHVRNRPYRTIGHNAYLDARAFYNALRICLDKIPYTPSKEDSLL